MKELDFSNIVPLYLQLAELIRKKIIEGELNYSEQIPTEIELSERYAISRNTVRRAINLLVEEDFLEKKQGKGTFVKPPIYVEQVSHDGSFSASVERSMSSASTRVLSIQTIECPQLVRDELWLPADEKVIFLSRLRKINGIPAILEEDFFPIEYSFLLTLDLNEQSIFKILKDYSGLQLDNSKILLEAIGATKEHMKALNIGEDHPILVMKQTVFEKLKPIYFNIQYIRSDVYKSTVYTAFPFIHKYQNSKNDSGKLGG